MRRNVTSESSTLEMASSARPRGALLASLVLLTASFLLLVLGPMLLARFQGSAQSMPASGFLSMAAASGIALGGGAAMIAVVSRLVRDIELRPYAGLAPVLGVFGSFVLWGLRAQLPLEGVAAEYVGVFALMVAVAGGALIAQRSGSRFVGWGIAFFGPLSLAGLMWAHSGKANIVDAYGTLAPPQKMFMGLLFASGLAMAVLGEASRKLARKQVAAPVEYTKTTQTFGAAREPLFANQVVAPVPAARGYQPVLPQPTYERYTQSDDAFAQGYAARADSSSPKLNVWDMHDELELPKRFTMWKMLLVATLVLAAGGAGIYYGVILPERAREAEAAQLLEQRKQLVAAEQQKQDAEARAKEDKVLLEQLEKMAAPAPNNPAAEAPAMGGAAAIPPAVEAPASPAAPAP